ncbi:hypothetical protein AGOR_G00230350 [Albula goreensis]|uniref:Dehydrogenase/reductase SDR family member 7B n=1 Tax=Albula goreensis TaxID=1534307 RepID=A0A8T3CLG0_9TELE|nr:hypothetical protein AGOR_G00230350 [Albula goreensis]
MVVISCSNRRTALGRRSMELFGNMVPLVLGSAGLLLLLYQLLQRTRHRANIQDAVVVITGASSGLGKECARVFHAAGARLILCGRDRARLQELAQDLKEVADSKQKMHTASIVTFDLSDTEAVASAAEEILKCHGHVDILINNAGVSYRGTILSTHVDVHKQVMGINYFGPVALTQAILPSMVQRKSGHVAVISSVQGKISIPFRSAYSASKHATQAYLTACALKWSNMEWLCPFSALGTSEPTFHSTLSLVTAPNMESLTGPQQRGRTQRWWLRQC